MTIEEGQTVPIRFAKGGSSERAGKPPVSTFKNLLREDCENQDTMLEKSTPKEGRAWSISPGTSGGSSVLLRFGHRGG